MRRKAWVVVAVLALIGVAGCKEIGRVSDGLDRAETFVDRQIAYGVGTGGLR